MLLLKNGKSARRLAALERCQAIIEYSADGTIIAVNDSFLRLAGYGRQETVGRHHRMFVDPVEAASAGYAAFWEALKSGERQCGEFRRIRKDGGDLWIAATYSPVLAGGCAVESIVASAVEISERKSADILAAGHIKAVNRSLAVVEFTPDGLILDANQNFLALTGYAREELVGRHHRILVGQATANSPAYAEFWQRLRSGGVESGEFRRFGKDGGKVWLRGAYNPVLDASGAVTRIVKIASDITLDKAKSTDARSQVEAINRSQAVIEFALDGTILSANANFLRTMGYELNEIVRRKHAMFVDEEELGSAGYAQLWAGLREGRFLSGVVRRRGKGGRLVWLQASYNPIFDLDGAPVKVVKYAADITERMQSREKLVRAAAETHGDVKAVAAAIEQLNASVSEIAQHMSQSRVSVQAIDSQAKIADESASGLDAAAQSLNDIAEFIKTIASQINLLSLNATIEAARAGDAGRGFAVVASEVKSLAAQVATATGEIGTQIANLQRSSSLVAETLKAITSAVGAVEGAVTSVAAALDEHQQVTSEVARNMSQLVKVSDINQSLSDLVAA